MSDDKELPKILVEEVFGFGHAVAGDKLCVEVRDQNDRHAIIVVAHTVEGDFLLNFQQAGLLAAKVRGQLPAESITDALRVRGIGLGVTDNNKIGLRLILGSGSALDLIVSESATEQLRSALAELDKYQSSVGPEVSQ